MGYDDDAFSHLMGAFFQNICDVNCGILVQISSRLVRKDNACIRSQCTGDCHSLLLTARELQHVSSAFFLRLTSYRHQRARRRDAEPMNSGAISVHRLSYYIAGSPPNQIPSASNGVSSLQRCRARIFLTGYPSILGMVYVDAGESCLQTIKIPPNQNRSGESSFH